MRTPEEQSGSASSKQCSVHDSEGTHGPESGQHRGLTKVSEPMRVFQRYKNRRLYEKGSGRKYQGLTQLVPLILRGESFRVVCNQTKNDVTHRVLGNLLVWGKLHDGERQHVVRLMEQIAV